jgi:hypothetical protein
MAKPEEGNRGQSGAAHERNAERQADQRQRKADREEYRDQWRTEHPGEEFPGFPPELGGGDEDEGEDTGETTPAV